MKCLTCENETSNPKYCSRSCAAKSTNKSHPKRKPEGRCSTCETPIHGHRAKFCKECWQAQLTPAINKSKNSNQGNNPSIREQARKLYIQSGRPMSCLLCEYDKHVDICHIKDVRDYADGTLFSVINHESNLIALCKNHHWEFDHDVL